MATHRRAALVNSPAARRCALAIALACLGGEASAGAQAQLELAGVFGITEPGPIERAAHPVSDDNPIPIRTLSVPPAYPAEAIAVKARVVVTLRVVVDDLGDVAELRVSEAPLLAAWQRGATPDTDPMPAVFSALVRAASDAVRQWRYEAPVSAPIAFDVAVSFAPDDEPRVVERAGAGPPAFPPAPQLPPGELVSLKPAPWADGVARAGDRIAMPMKIKHASPVFPVEAREAGVGGIVVVEARIEPDGRIVHARVLRSIPALDQAVLDAVLQWEFTPTLVNGTPVPVLLTSTFQFSAQ